MKPKIAIVTTISLLLNMMLPQPVSADAYTGDLERLHWLCSDYQLPVKGYVIEGWFMLSNRPGLQSQLQRQLQLKEGQQQGQLLDGSILNSSLLRNGQKYYIELQLITEHLETAQHYYALWQNFADYYGSKKPIGVTVITELPEVLEEAAITQLSGELQQSLQMTQSNTVSTEQAQQICGYSPQLYHTLDIGGEKINCNIAFVQQETKTAVYLATPVIYQQY